MSELFMAVSPVTDLEKQVRIAVESGYSVEQVVKCLEAIASSCQFVAQDMRECPELYSGQGGD